MKKQYRLLLKYGEYWVQVKVLGIFWYTPRKQYGFNTMGDAEVWAERYSKNFVVKDLGYLP